jgi:hypothetical protein
VRERECVCVCVCLGGCDTERISEYHAMAVGNLMLNIKATFPNTKKKYD